MKILLTLLVLIGTVAFGAEEAPSMSAISLALRTSKIAKLEFDKVTFEQGLGVIRDEWKKQHPEINFPVSIAEYEKHSESKPTVTMSLHDVPFIKALQYLGDASKMRLVKKPDLLTFEDYALIVEDWITMTYPASDELLAQLKLGKHPTSEDLASAYAQFGVKLEDWMKIGYQDGFIIVHAFDEQQQQIAGINHLLSNGYHIIKGKPTGTAKPAVSDSIVKMIDCDPKDEILISKAYESFLNLIAKHAVMKEELRFPVSMANQNNKGVTCSLSYYISPNELRGFEVFVPKDFITKKDGLFISTESLMIDHEETKQGIRCLTLKKSD